MFEKYTAYQPIQTVTTTTTWAGWRTVNPRCLLCVYCAMRGDIPVCWCTSRTLKAGTNSDECLSYWAKGAVRRMRELGIEV